MVGDIAAIIPVDEHAASNIHFLIRNISHRCLHLLESRGGGFAGNHYLIVKQGRPLVEEPRLHIWTLIPGMQRI